MKKSLIMLCLLCIVTGSFAKKNYKVLDKSTRRAPEWVNGMEENFIISSANANSIEEAKEKCLINIKRHILEAVAQNISVNSQSSAFEKMENNETMAFVEEYSTQTDSKGANLPFISEISLSNVVDFYWEHIRFKETKKEEFVYHVKYPLSKLKLNQLIDQFNEYDGEMEHSLDSLEANLMNINSVEEIDNAISKLKSLQKYFFDNTRLAKTKNTIKAYNNIYQSISISRLSNKLGEEVYALTYGNRVISYSKPPRVKSNTVGEISTSKSGNKWNITYNHSTAYEEDDNYLDVLWIVKGRSIKQRFYISLGQKINAVPSDKITLIANIDDQNNITSIDMSMNILNQNNSSFTIKNIVLRSDYTITPLVFENIEKQISGKGSHTITLSTSNFRLNKNVSIANPLGIGTMTATSNDGETIKIDFSILTEFIQP